MSIEKLRPSFTFDSDRLRELATVVPEAFADGQINWDTLREALGEHLEDETQEHFGLFWPGKREARRLASLPSKGTLAPQPGQGVDEDTTHNLFIEGDNLEVLKLLQKSYAGRIDLVYIDPPYNTGDDFIYPDDYSEPLDMYLIRTGQMDDSGNKLTTKKNEGGRFHSNWLSMMYPRLVEARGILRDDGIIVIHIDEHEYSTLYLLLNEIFGEENNLGTIVWDKKNPKGDATGIAYQHESIIVFAMNRQRLLQETEMQRAKKNAQAILNKAKELYKKIGNIGLPDDLQECISTYNIPSEVVKKHNKKLTLADINTEFSSWIKSQNFSGGEIAYSQIDENGEVYQSVSMAWPNKKRAPEEYFTPLIHPITKKPCPIPAR
jgi:adenine-specific DNA-methyltransferase